MKKLTIALLLASASFTLAVPTPTPTPTATPVVTSGTIDIPYVPVATITPTGNCTFTTSAYGNSGDVLSLIVTTSGTTSYALTFSSNFISNGSISTGTVSGAVIHVTFRCDTDRATWVEISRTLADDFAFVDAATGLRIATLSNSTIASASTLNLNSVAGPQVDVTGTTTITAITLTNGDERIVRFTGVLTLTNGASLKLPGDNDIITANGDYAFVSGGAGAVVTIARFQKASSAPQSAVADLDGGSIHHLAEFGISGGGLSDGFELLIRRKSSSVYSNDRTLQIGLQDGDRTLVLGGNVQFGGAFTTIGPTQFAGNFTTTLTATATTDSTLPAGTHTLASLDDLTASISDTAYNATSWDGVTTIAPSKNAVRDKIEALQPLDSDLTSWAAITRASGFDTFTATPSSANLRGLLTDENGTGVALFDSSTNATFITPTLGAATATSINKVAITAPATSATLTIANGKTLTANNSITLAGTDSTTMTFPTTSASVARIDAAQSFTGLQTFASATGINISGFNTSNSQFKVGTFEAQSYALNNGWFGDNIYYDGSNFKNRATGASAMFYFNNDEINFRNYISSSAGTSLAQTSVAKISPTGAGFGSAIVINTDVFTGSRFYVDYATAMVSVLYDASNQFTTTISSTGGVTLDAIGSGAGFTFNDQIINTVPMRLKGYTVATLPAGTQGDTAFVTDALAPTFLATVVGGGAVVTPVFYNGSAWVGY